MGLLKLLSTDYSYKGSDFRGIPRYRGTTNRPPLWYCCISLLGGSLLCFLVLAGKDPLFVRGYYALISGWLLNQGYRNWKIYRAYPKLLSVDMLCGLLNVDKRTLRQIVVRNDINPRYNINELDFYDINDFGDAATLLRASAAPANPQETLLRPAAQTETPPELLLRVPESTPKITATTEPEQENETLRVKG